MGVVLASCRLGMRGCRAVWGWQLAPLGSFQHHCPMRVCARACMCVSVHTCVIDSLQGRPQLGWETAEFLLSVALRKRWVLNSISPEVLWFHMCYQRESEKSPRVHVWVSPQLSAHTSSWSPPPHWPLVAFSLWRPLRFRLWLPSGRGPASPSTRSWGRRMSSSGKQTGPSWCLRHKTLVTGEEGPCAVWMSPGD